MRKKLLGKPLSRNLLIGALAASILLFFLPLGGIASNRWTANGIPVCTAPGTQRRAECVPDGSGGTIIVWEDKRSMNFDIYAQRLSPAGIPLWGSNGVAVCTAADHQLYPKLVPDGNGGAFIAWYDNRAGVPYPYVQKLDLNGNPLWHSNGIALCLVPNGVSSINIVPDGAGGAVLCWRDHRSDFMGDTYAQRIDSAGNKLWATNGVPVCNHSYTQLDPVIASSGQGQTIIAWVDFRAGPTSRIFAQKLDADGNNLWQLNGVNVCGVGGGQTSPVIVPRENGGAIIAWRDFRTEGAGDIYAQSLDFDGNKLWPANGVPVCDVTGTQGGLSMKPDGKSGAVMAWQDNRSGGNDIYAQRIGSDGNPKWTEQGLPVCTAADQQLYPCLEVDSFGNTIIAWDDSRTPDRNIYAQKLSPNGAAQWQTNGASVCTATDIQWATAICTDGTSGAIIIWRDCRADTSSGDLYAQKVSDYGETWYLAEGTTAWGFSTYITIENPNPEPTNVEITYMTEVGAVPGGMLTLPARSQTTVNPETVVPNRDFSTKLASDGGKPIFADRTMVWTGPGAPSSEAHCSAGVPSPAEVWYLPEGSSEWGFECWLLIQNPNPVQATCRITYMIEGAPPQVLTKTVPANSRRTYNMAGDIGSHDASIQVESNVPVIPERSMYRNNRREGHVSIGTTEKAEGYFLAEGTSAWGFTTYILVQNPNSTSVDVTITYMTDSGPVPQPTFSMSPNSRETIRVNDVLPNRDFSTMVYGSRPIIAERAMYWGEGTALGEACHDSIGLPRPYRNFYLPDGQTTEGRETWTLVQNPNPVPVSVEISYLREGGEGVVTITDTVDAFSRKTYNMANAGVNGRASVLVRCLTPNRLIMVERAMYWNNRGAGTGTIGGYSY